MICDTAFFIFCVLSWGSSWRLFFPLLWYLLLNFACGACDTILNWSYLFSGGRRQLDYLHKLHIQLYFPLNKGKWDALGLYCIFIIFVSLYIYYFLWFVILYLFLVIFTFYLQPWSDSALEFSTVGCVSCFLVALYLFTFHVRGIGGLLLALWPLLSTWWIWCTTSCLLCPTFVFAASRCPTVVLSCVASGSPLHLTWCCIHFASLARPFVWTSYWVHPGCTLVLLLAFGWS